MYFISVIFVHINDFDLCPQILWGPTEVISVVNIMFCFGVFNDAFELYWKSWMIIFNDILKTKIGYEINFEWNSKNIFLRSW